MTLSDDIKRFTVVFDGDVRAFKTNPLNIVSEFGQVVGVTASDLQDKFDQQDALIRQQQELLREAYGALDTAREELRHHGVSDIRHLVLLDKIKTALGDV